MVVDKILVNVVCLFGIYIYIYYITYELINRVRGLYGEVFVETESVWGVHSDRAMKERGLCEKTKGKYFPVETDQTRIIRNLLYPFWFIFFKAYSAVFVFRCCRSQCLQVSWFRFIFTLVGHSFASLIHINSFQEKLH